MEEKEGGLPSNTTMDNFSSTATLAKNDQLKASTDYEIGHVPEEKYDQYEHRVVEHPNTFSGALIHLLKCSLGTGILAIPRAIKTAGLAVGTLGTILIGLLCAYTVHLLVSASQKVCKRTKTPSLSYSKTVKVVFQCGPEPIRKFANIARNFSEIAIVLTHFMGNSVYIVLISESITKLIGYYYPQAESWDQYVELAILVPLIICCQIRELKHLVPFSFVANVNLFTAIGITLYYTFSNLKSVNISDRAAATSVSSLPSFFSTVVFAMEGIGTIMPLENSMLKDEFIGCPSVLNIGMTIIVATYASMGFFGYLAFGEQTEAAITHNLPSEQIPAQVVQGCISAAVFFTFMLQFYVPMDIIWCRINKRFPKEKHSMIQIIMRTLFVSLIVGIAAAAGHHLDALIDLVGALFLATLGLVIPPVLDIIVNWKNWGRLSWILYKDIILLLFGLFGTISGTYNALKNFTV